MGLAYNRTAQHAGGPWYGAQHVGASGPAPTVMACIVPHAAAVHVRMSSVYVPIYASPYAPAHARASDAFPRTGYACLAPGFGIHHASYLL